MDAREEDLVARACEGDTDAFGEIVELHQRLMMSVAIGILDDNGKAEDAVQDAFLAAWRSLASFRREASLKNWLCRIVVNKAHSTLRWARLRRWLSLDEPSQKNLAEEVVDSSAEGDPARLSLQEERARAIRKAVASLPLQQRTAVSLRGNGLGLAEVADAMGVAEGTVKATLNHARASLAKALEGRGS